MRNKLKRYKVIYDQLEIVRLEKEFIYNEYYAMSAPPCDREFSTGGKRDKNPLLTKMIKHDDDLTRYKSDLDRLEKELLQERLEIMGVIKQLPNREYQVIYYRYIQFMKEREIAELLYIDERTVRRYHKSALERLEKVN